MVLRLHGPNTWDILRLLRRRPGTKTPRLRSACGTKSGHGPIPCFRSAKLVAYCIRQLGKDISHDIHSEVVRNLTFEELIGALLQAEHEIIQAQHEIMHRKKLEGMLDDSDEK